MYVIYGEKENQLQNKVEKKASKQKKKKLHNNIVWSKYVKLLHVDICICNVNLNKV